MRAVTLPALLAVLATGCTWSDEDILFKLAAPGRDTLRLKVPGAEILEQQASAATQALGGVCEGDEAETVTCGTRGLAATFNAITFSLLGIVDHVTTQNPSKREQGLRVWGPFHIADKGFTARFEMHREPAGFSYCLHVAAGNRTGPFADDGVRCGKDAGPFIEVFTGSFVPEPGASDEPQARHGIGKMVLDLNIQRRAGAAGAKDQGRYTFEYDTRGGKTAIDIAIEQITDDETGLPASAVYHYLLDEEGVGEMHLELRKQLRCGFFDCDGNRETLRLGAQWNAEGAARVDALAFGGDLGDQQLRGWECSQSDLRIVARHYDWDPDKDLGSESACPFEPLTVE